MEAAKRVDIILAGKERVLYPETHGGHAPFHEHEVQNALEL